jgi:hypothetical protein
VNVAVAGGHDILDWSTEKLSTARPSLASGSASRFTEAMVAEKPEKKEAPLAMPGGGMGDLDA